MCAAELMGSVYWQLLQKLEQRKFDVFGPTPTKLTRMQKGMLVFKTWCQVLAGTMAPNYGTP
jgi:hypothetical protein